MNWFNLTGKNLETFVTITKKFNFSNMNHEMLLTFKTPSVNKIQFTESSVHPMFQYRLTWPIRPMLFTLGQNSHSSVMIPTAQQ